MKAMMLALILLFGTAVQAEIREPVYENGPKCKFCEPKPAMHPVQYKVCRPVLKQGYTEWWRINWRGEIHIYQIPCTYWSYECYTVETFSRRVPQRLPSLVAPH